MKNTNKDIFKSFLVEDAVYSGKEEFPVVYSSLLIPNRLITFSKAVKSNDYDQWVVFYEDDAKINRIWENPRRYLSKIKKFNGVIGPDFSLYRNMPQVMQNGLHIRAGRCRIGFNRTALRLFPMYAFQTSTAMNIAVTG